MGSETGLMPKPRETGRKLSGGAGCQAEGSAVLHDCGGLCLRGSRRKRGPSASGSMTGAAKSGLDRTVRKGRRIPQANACGKDPMDAKDDQRRARRLAAANGHTLAHQIRTHPIAGCRGALLPPCKPRTCKRTRCGQRPTASPGVCHGAKDMHGRPCEAARAQQGQPPAIGRAG